MVVGLVDSNQFLPTLLLLNSSNKLWVWPNSRVWLPRQWVNLALEQGSKGNLEARLVWVSSSPTR
jgi:hypothetical protein